MADEKQPEKEPSAEKEFDPDYEEFVKWEATPLVLIDDTDNWPQTMQEEADKLKVSRQTLYDWRKRPGHWEHVKDVYNSLHGRRLQKVRDALFTRTQGVIVETVDKKGTPVYKDLPPDVKAIELFFEYEDKWNRKNTLDVSGKVDVGADRIIQALFKAKQTGEKK